MRESAASRSSQLVESSKRAVASPATSGARINPRPALDASSPSQSDSLRERTSNDGVPVAAAWSGADASAFGAAWLGAADLEASGAAEAEGFAGDFAVER